MAIVFDTHRAVKSLEQAGISEPAAEALISTIRVVIKNMVTKTDLKNAVEGLNGRIDNTNERITGLDKSLNASIGGVDKSLTARIGGVEKTTNASIDGLKNSTNARIDALEKNIDVRFESFGKAMTIRMGMLFYSAVALAAALYALWGKPL